MKIVGLTGGMGSGKSTIAKLFQALGIPVYIADVEAKKILATSVVVKRKVIDLLGEQAYVKTVPNRDYIAQKIFNDTTLLAQMNAIIHPKVASHFKVWLQKQTAFYCIKEAAVLFENGGFTQCDATILVTAPKQVRIDRVIARDMMSIASVTSRMQHQWTDKKKIPMATYVLENIDLDSTKLQVKKIHKELLIA
jgi:dephospho-CoA kinase